MRNSFKLDNILIKQHYFNLLINRHSGDTVRILNTLLHLMELRILSYCFYFIPPLFSILLFSSSSCFLFFLLFFLFCLYFFSSFDRSAVKRTAASFLPLSSVFIISLTLPTLSFSLSISIYLLYCSLSLCLHTLFPLSLSISIYLLYCSLSACIPYSLSLVPHNSPSFLSLS